MRLFLSSENIAKEEELAKLIGGKNKRVAVIVNSADWHTVEERQERLNSEFSNLNKAGFVNCYELDLRKYIELPDALPNSLEDVDLIWVRGGNVFYLRWLMKSTGIDNLLINLLNKDALVYGGYSAGAIMVTPTLRGMDTLDDPSKAPEQIWDGLRLVDYSIIPHWNREDYKDKTLAVREYFVNHNMPFKTLEDGEVIIVDGDKEYRL